MKFFHIIFILILLHFSAQSSDWVKYEGCSGGINIKYIKYENTNSKFIKIIDIGKQYTGDFYIMVNFAETKNYLQGESLIKNEFKKAGFNDFTLSPGYRGNNLNRIRDIFKLINKWEPLGNLLQEIALWMDVKMLDYKIIMDLATSGKYEEAIKDAINIKNLDKELLWNLGEYFYDNKLFHYALEVYQEIEEANPYYIESGKRCDAIIMGILNLDQIEKKLKKEEKRSYTKQRLKFALQAKDSRLAGRLFEELSGLKLPDEALDNFKGDFETLVAICDSSISKLL